MTESPHIKHRRTSPRLSPQLPRMQVTKYNNRISIQPDLSGFVSDKIENNIDYKGDSTVLECIRKEGGNYISKEIAVKILDGEYRSQYDEVIWIDCRFPYEFEGGHIKGAVNLNDPINLEQMFFTNPGYSPRKCVIFYCEFSHQRGPQMCKLMRQRDREIHGFMYHPQLYYPEVYILRGGYREFFPVYSSYCVPCEYISMKDANFSKQCQAGFRQLRKYWRDYKDWMSNNQSSQINTD